MAYAQVNGVNMYYETHGSGPPLVLLHGGLSMIGLDFGALLPTLAGSHTVIGIEQQAHGHTADVDRPLSFDAMTEGTSGLLRKLEVENADFLGYSMGGGIAVHVAIRHPELVRKLVFVGGVAYSPDGYYPELLAGMAHMKPEDLVGSPFHEAYVRNAPDPHGWTALVEKMKELDLSWKGLTAEEVRSIQAPALLVIGDADIVRPEHTVEMFRLLGGGVLGDFVGLPPSRLAVLPGSTHITVMQRTELLLSMVTEFLDAPIPRPGKIGSARYGVQEDGSTATVPPSSTRTTPDPSGRIT